MQNPTYQVNGCDNVAYNDSPNQRYYQNDEQLESAQQLQDQMYQQPQLPTLLPRQKHNATSSKEPHVKITVQPASKACRFRYECEGRVAGAILGEHSSADCKSYPAIEIVGYKGRAVVVVSCVTKDPPHKPHPHNLVGKKYCTKGVCTMEVNSDTMTAVFNNLSIQCVKRKDIESSLKLREEIRVDPFKTGFKHRLNPRSIDLYALRLCFQVFIEAERGRFTRPLTPVVSEPLFDRKAISSLVICRLCSCSAPVSGNTPIMLACEKVARDDILVRFFENYDGFLVWEAFGKFQPAHVYKQSIIRFQTPPYRILDITEPVQVYVQLQKKSTKETSEAIPFEYIPDLGNLRRKRQRTGGDPNLYLKEKLSREGKEEQQINPNLPLLLPTPTSPPVPQNLQHLPVPVACHPDNRDTRMEVDFDQSHQQPTHYSPQHHIGENNHQFTMSNVKNFNTNMFDNQDYPANVDKLIAAVNNPPSQTQWNNLAQQVENILPSDVMNYENFPTPNFQDAATKISRNQDIENVTSKENGPTISSLLNISSAQLLQMDTENQKNFHLNPDELKYSNFPIYS